MPTEEVYSHFKRSQSPALEVVLTLNHWSPVKMIKMIQESQNGWNWMMLLTLSSLPTLSPAPSFSLSLITLSPSSST